MDGIMHTSDSENDSHYDHLFALLADSMAEMMNRLLGDSRVRTNLRLDNPSRLEWPIAFDGDLRREDAFRQRLMISFNEIFMSFNTLQIAPGLLRRTTRRGSASPSLLVRYHMDAYLNEAYILYLRLDNFAKRIAREYRKDSVGGRLNADLDWMLPTLRLAFRGIIEVRGRHVHSERYDDPQLRSLWLLENISQATGNYETEFALVFRNVKRDKVEFLASTTKASHSLMDRICRYYVEVLFDGDGNLRIPSNIAAA
jgi:hypothetical protein